MPRRHSNAGERVHVIPLDVRKLGFEPTKPTLMVVVDTTARSSVRDHAFRDAAKHTPSRVTSRLYAAVRAIGDTLDDADRHLGAAALTETEHRELAEHVTMLRRSLELTREQVEAATSDRAVADQVKAALSDVGARAGVLEPALTALTYHAKAARCGQGVHADAVGDLLAALASGSTSTVTHAATTLRTLVAAPAA